MAPVSGSRPSLPFLVEAYGPREDTTYIVSKVDRLSVKDKYFSDGVVITHWNGIPFGRALELNAEVETGGRPDSRLARALESLTFRALEYAPPPNEEWVDIDFFDLWDKRRKIRLHWEEVFEAMPQCLFGDFQIATSRSHLV